MITLDNHSTPVGSQRDVRHTKREVAREERAWLAGPGGAGGVGRVSGASVVEHGWRGVAWLAELAGLARLANNCHPQCACLSSA